ncbi:MAG: hypothetical protein IJV45_00680 [Prevotella sp.]|nr:hypothetical protein [Prevotella sp.]
MKRVSLSLMVFAVLSGAAKTIYVSPTGSDRNSGQSLASALATFDEALSRAADGDRILFTGTMRPAEAVVVDGLQDVVIEGRASGMADNVIDGGHYCGLFQLKNGARLTLRNLVVRGGKTQQRGGAITIDKSALTMEQCELYNNQTACDVNTQGGAVYVNAGQLTMTDVTFYGNRSYQGGALSANESVVNAYNVVFEQNQTWLDDESVSRPSEARGGAAVLTNCQTVMNFCTFTGNASKGDGGALWVLTRREGCSFDMNGCAITNNRAGGPQSAVGGMHGGAIIYGAYAPVVANIRSTTIALNTTPSAGGALFYTGDAEGSRLNIVNCTVTKNQTLSNAGNCGGLNINDKALAEVNIVNTIVENNHCLNNQLSDYVFGTSAHISQQNSIVGTDADDPSGIVPQMECERRCFPLMPSSRGTTMGDLSLARDYGCMADQNGQPMTKTYLGAVQSLDGEDMPHNPTDINEVTVYQTEEGAFYNLQGIRVAHPTKNLYIHQGKKVISSF